MDADVTQAVGEHFGRMHGKSLSIKHVDNGFIVDYTMPAKKPTDYEKTARHTRVFLDPGALLSFVAGYFGGKVDDA